MPRRSIGEILDRASTLRLTRIAHSELERARRHMRIPQQPRPYYLAFLIRDEESWRFHAKYGALKAETHDRKRNALVDIRVGSHRADQVRDGGLEDNDKEAESYGYVDLPFGQRLDGVRHGLWRLTDARYREALETLLHKESHELTYRNPYRHLDAFEKRPERSIWRGVSCPASTATTGWTTSSGLPLPSNGFATSRIPMSSSTSLTTTEFSSTPRARDRFSARRSGRWSVTCGC